MLSFLCKKHKDQKGLTLIEVAMVLAIAAVVIGGVMTLYLSTSNQRKLTDTTQLVVSAVQKISDLYSGKDFTGFDGTTAVTDATLPASYISADKKSYNLPIANTTMQFGTADITSPIKTDGVILLGPLTSDQCIAMAKLDLGPVVEGVQAGTGVTMPSSSITLSALQTVGSSAGSYVKDSTGNITIANVAGACASAAADTYIAYFITT